MKKLLILFSLLTLTGCKSEPLFPTGQTIAVDHVQTKMVLNKLTGKKEVQTTNLAGTTVRVTEDEFIICAPWETRYQQATGVIPSGKILESRYRTPTSFRTIL